MKRVTILDSELIELPYQSEAERVFLVKILLRKKGINTDKPYSYWREFKTDGFTVVQEEVG